MKPVVFLIGIFVIVGLFHPQPGLSERAVQSFQSGGSDDPYAFALERLRHYGGRAAAVKEHMTGIVNKLGTTHVSGWIYSFNLADNAAEADNYIAQVDHYISELEQARATPADNDADDIAWLSYANYAYAAKSFSFLLIARMEAEAAALALEQTTRKGPLEDAYFSAIRDATRDVRPFPEWRAIGYRVRASYVPQEQAIDRPVIDQYRATMTKLSDDLQALLDEMASVRDHVAATRGPTWSARRYPIVILIQEQMESIDHDPEKLFMYRFFLGTIFYSYVDWDDVKYLSAEEAYLTPSKYMKPVVVPEPLRLVPTTPKHTTNNKPAATKHGDHPAATRTPASSAHTTSEPPRNSEEGDTLARDLVAGMGDLLPDLLEEFQEVRDEALHQGMTARELKHRMTPDLFALEFTLGQHDPQDYAVMVAKDRVTVVGTNRYTGATKTATKNVSTLTKAKRQALQFLPFLGIGLELADGVSRITELADPQTHVRLLEQYKEAIVATEGTEASLQIGWFMRELHGSNFAAYAAFLAAYGYDLGEAVAGAPPKTKTAMRDAIDKAIRELRNK